MWSRRILATFCAFGFIVACTPTHVDFIIKGQPLLGLDIQTVSELDIVKADPNSGDHWSARLVRNPQGEWEISSVENQTLIDRHANSTFVNHLLDTLRTLHVVGPPPSQGSPESYGLQAPIFTFKWKVDTTPGSHYLRLGDPAHEGTYAELENEKSERAAVAVIDGALIQMVGFLKTSDSIRQKTLPEVDADDVDEIEFRSHGKRELYAQRDGDTWRDQRHKPIHFDVEGTLQALTHARVKEFIDDASKADEFRRKVEKSPDFEATFKDRQGHPTVLSLKKANGDLLAIVSTRPGAVFYAYPELAKNPQLSGILSKLRAKQ